MPSQAFIARILPRLACLVLVISSAGLASPSEAEPACGGKLVPLSLSESWRPFIREQIQGKEALFLIDTANNHSIIRPIIYGKVRTSPVFIPSSAFPGWYFLGRSIPEDDSFVSVDGIVGTDIFAKYALEFNYEAQPYLSISKFCNEIVLRSAGYARVQQASMASEYADWSKPPLLMLLSKIGQTKPLPVVIDTGAANSVIPGVVQVNKNFLDQLVEQRVELHETQYDLTRRDCNGEATKAKVFSVDLDFEIIDRETGKDIATYPPPTLIKLIVDNKARATPFSAKKHRFRLL